MHWLIETGVFPETAPRVCAAIEARGDRWTRYDGEPVELSGRVVFWGSLGAAYGERVAARWQPGAIGEIEHFAVSRYAPKLGELLANADAVMTTVRDLVAHPPAHRVFVRPDSALKPFAGRVLEPGGVTLAALDHGFYYDDDALPIAVSAARTIGREWRTVIAAGRVIAGCGYSTDRRGAEVDVPDAVQALASQVAGGEWQPAPIYIADVAEVDGALRVLELNPFSGADLYHCDPATVVEAVARLFDA